LVRFILSLVTVLMFSACSVVKGTVDGVATVGKVGWTAAKVTGKTVHTTGKVAYHTGNALYKTGKVTSKVVHTVAYLAKGKQIVPLKKVGSSLYTTVKLGKQKIPAQLLIDTGASVTQITLRLAKELGLNLERAETVPARLANGQIVYAKEVTIPQIILQGARVLNMRALVLDNEVADGNDGLLGMSFLDQFVFQIDAEKPELVLHQKVK